MTLRPTVCVAAVQMKTGIPGIEVSVSKEAVLVRSDLPLRVLSSAVAGGGRTEVRWIVNRHVPKGYQGADPVADLTDFAGRQGIHEPFVGLMTAALMERARCVSLRAPGITVCCIATAGLSNPAASGLTPPAEDTPGTINLVLLIDGRLTEAAMVNAVITATEAKSAVLMERETRTPEGYRATGTSTDAVVVGCTGREPAIAFAGPVTQVGFLIGRCVREALTLALASA